MSFLDTQEFTITEPTGIKIVAFAVNYASADKLQDMPICRLEKIESSQKDVEGRIQKTFSIPTEEKEVQNVIMISLAKSKCVIGYGTVKENEFFPDNSTIHLEYTNIGNLNGEPSDFSFKFNPKRQMMIIDADSGEPMIPAISRDQVTKEMKGNYKLIPFKNYIAMELAILPLQKQKRTNADLANMIV